MREEAEGSIENAALLGGGAQPLDVGRRKLVPQDEPLGDDRGSVKREGVRPVEGDVPLVGMSLVRFDGSDFGGGGCAVHNYPIIPHAAPGPGIPCPPSILRVTRASPAFAPAYYAPAVHDRE